MRKAFFVFAIILSTVVLVLSIVGVVGVWVAERVATDVTMEATAAIDEAAQAARDGIQRLNARVATARETVDTIEAAATLAGRDVVERGVAAPLLSEEREQQLNAEIQDAVDSFENFRQGLLAIVHLIRAIDRIPMVELPEPDPERIRDAGERIDGLEMRAAELGNRLSEFRAEAAGAALEVRDAAMQISARLGEIQEDLAQVDTRLAGVQARAIHLQQTLPTVFTLIAIVSSLLLVWVSYSQVVVIRSFWSKLRQQPGGER